MPDRRRVHLVRDLDAYLAPTLRLSVEQLVFRDQLGFVISILPLVLQRVEIELRPVFARPGPSTGDGGQGDHRAEDTH